MLQAIFKVVKLGRYSLLHCFFVDYCNAAKTYKRLKLSLYPP